MEQNLQNIKAVLDSSTEEIEVFKEFLQEADSDYLDERVHKFSKIVEANIDCTQCGNCCKNVLINFDSSEVAPVSNCLNISDEEFIDTYAEKGFGEMLLLKTVPCRFLRDNMCTIYPQRFNGCRGFPNLHQPGFKKRLSQFFLNIQICPIAFNTFEMLKADMGFEQ